MAAAAAAPSAATSHHTKRSYMFACIFTSSELSTPSDNDDNDDNDDDGVNGTYRDRTTNAHSHGTTHTQQQTRIQFGTQCMRVHSECVFVLYA